MTTATGAGQWRVDFDAEVVFSNGGSLRTEGFRLDIPGDRIDDGDLGELLVRHLGLLMVGGTVITRKELIREPHKGSRNTGADGEPPARRTVDLTGPGTRVDRPAGAPDGIGGLVDLPVALVRLAGTAEPVADRLALAPFEPAGHAVVVHTGRPDGPYLTPDAVALLAERGAVLVATDSTERDGATAKALAEAGIPAVTGLTGLADLPAVGARLHTVPHPAGHGDGTGARVYGVAE
ncbi:MULTISPECIES: cyclase family protein [unclassified Streptomyces]|uniref:cyclase family protein n=1 Tax=unclassified Streptomyces TaxID=2593676 RepID=UPI0016615421|nr:MULTISPECIES: cyclase family protein [unclassified Streptomyces]MBD0709783.1 hypothetical protein [Streptomyces sp. CBMA291]MBD0717700.1 hypothetical protein [Streptomyces sp. CBMA370]